MSFIEYLNRQLNPTGDADMQAAMNWGLAPGFPVVKRPLPWDAVATQGAIAASGAGGLGASAGAAAKATPRAAKQVYAPKQSRTASSSGRMSQAKAPRRNIPTLPTPKPQMPVGVSMYDAPAGPQLPPSLPAFGDDRGGVAFEDAGFAPPMVPQMDYSQAMPFGQPQAWDAGLPMQYADMPMPEVLPVETAPAPVPQSPVLSLGLGRNVSPWGTMDTYKNVADMARRDKAFAQGKKVHTPEEEAAASRALGFIGPDGRIMQAHAHTMRAAALPMEAAPAVAAGLQGGASEDELPMPSNPVDREAMQAQLEAIQNQRDAYDREARRAYWVNGVQNFGAALGGMAPSTKGYRPSQQAALNMQRNNALFNQFMQGGRNAQHQLNQDERQLYRDAYNAQHQYQQDLFARDRALTGRRSASAAEENARTNSFRAQESARHNTEAEARLRGIADEQRRHNQSTEENARNDDMRAMNDAALKAMADAMKFQQTREDRRLDRQSREGIASANREAANSRARARINASNSKSKALQARLKRLRQIESEVARSKKGGVVARQADIEAEFSDDEKRSVLKALKLDNPAATREDYLRKLLASGRESIEDDGPDEEPDDDADD